MAQIHWLNDVSGDFAAAANWSGGAVPGAGDGVSLSALAGTPYTVTASTAEHIDTLATAANASLVIGSTFQIDNLAGPSRNVGAIAVDGGALLTEGTFDNRGSLTLGGGTGKLVLENDLTLTGGGNLIGAANYGYVAGPRDNPTEFSLTNVDNLISGNVRIEVNQFRNLANGVFDATGASIIGSAVYAENGIVNDGVIENTGTPVLVLQAAELDQTGGGTLSVTSAAGARLFGSGQVGADAIDIIGGTLATSGTAIIGVYGGVLDGRTANLTIAGKISTASNPRYYFNNDDTGVEGTIVNKGEILDDPATHGRFTQYIPQLQVVGSAVLTGGGEVVMGSHGYFTTAGGSASLTNVDNTIVGVGQIGSGNLGAPGLRLVNEAGGLIEASGTRGQSLVVVTQAGLDNAGTIEASGAARLYLEEGTVMNSGEIIAGGAGGLRLSSITVDQSGGGSLVLAAKASLFDASVLGGTAALGAQGFLIGIGGSDLVTAAVSNAGRLEVTAGTLTVSGAVSGSGLGVIAGGTLAFTGAFDQRLQFLRGSGELELAQSQTYTAAVYGFSTAGGTSLDLRDIGFVGVGEASFSGTASKGVLTVTDGTHTAHITLVGNYLSAAFTAANDGHGGTVITASAAPHSRGPMETAMSGPSPQLLVAASASIGGGSHAGWSIHANAAGDPFLAHGLFAPRPALA